MNINRSNDVLATINPAPVRRSSRFNGAQSDNLCIPNYTKPGVDVVWKAANEKNNTTSEYEEVLAQDVLDHKTLEVSPLDEPHSAIIGGPCSMSSQELSIGYEASNHPYLHGTRASSSKDDFERTKKDKLDLPAPKNSSRTLLVPNSCKEPILEVDSSLRAEGKSPCVA